MAGLADDADENFGVSRILVVGDFHLMEMTTHFGLGATLRSLRRIGLLMLLILCFSACRKKVHGTEESGSKVEPRQLRTPLPASPESPADSPPAETPASVEGALETLAKDHSNPYLANNAAAALAAWNRHDYDPAAVYALTVLGLRLTPEQQAVMLGAFVGMRDGFERAARSGDASAKSALDRFSRFNPR